ncbi:alpha/beta hydrolase [Paraconexibacter sp.]|uniref:alpha/beta hydrolase n=1 Tax=Paraconexibacter sp. TaxID=2949640 RepID=UPI00356648DD
MRLLRTVLLTLLVAACASPVASAAARVETIDTPSRFVDPAKAAFNLPAGAEPREGRLRANVWLPAGYDGRRRFPVLYLLHGHGDAYDSWVSPRQGDLAETAAGLNAIVVMPEAARGWYADWWEGGKRGRDGRAWERYHLDELIPLIERRYRVSGRRRDHAIAGLSMGGLGALHYAAQRPGYFGSAASFSGAISIERPEWPTAFDTQGEAHDDVYGDPGDAAFYWQGHNPTAQLPNLRDTRLFVRVGDGTADPSRPAELGNWFGALAEIELRQQAEDFVRAARATGADVHYEPVAGIHDWPYWRDALRSAISWGLFEEVPEAPSRWAARTVQQTGRLWDTRFVFARPPEELVTFSRDGDRLRIGGTGRVHLAIKGGRRMDVTAPATVTVPPRRPRR